MTAPAARAATFRTIGAARQDANTGPPARTGGSPITLNRIAASADQSIGVQRIAL
jgi:hypothetical protein